MGCWCVCMCRYIHIYLPYVGRQSHQLGEHTCACATCAATPVYTCILSRSWLYNWTGVISPKPELLVMIDSGTACKYIIMCKLHCNLFNAVLYWALVTLHMEAYPIEVSVSWRCAGIFACSAIPCPITHMHAVFSLELLPLALFWACTR